MKTYLKVVIAGIVIIFIGLAILITALALNGWKFKPATKFETKTYTADGVYANISVKMDAGAVSTQFYDGEKIQIDYATAEGYETEITADGDKLSIICPKIKSWFTFSCGVNNIPETVIKLPRGTAYNINANVNAGTLKLADGIYGNLAFDMDAGTLKAGAVECAVLNCDMDAGTVKIEKLTCTTTIIKLDAGTAKLNFTGARSEYSVTAKVNAGTCKIDGQNATDQTGTTAKTINVNVSAGTVKLNFGN